MQLSPPRAFALLLCFLAGYVHADWPAFQHDMNRSGATTESAPANPELTWAYHAPSRPRTAWDEPALWDGWSKTHDLTNRQVFDKAFQVAVVGDMVYFGSSVDDHVYCLDAKDGSVRWTFCTEGPVRLAPTVAGSDVLVGSDDGQVYCLDAETGQLRWKHRPGPGHRRVAGNGRVISPWAIRTSVVVVDDKVYCGAGVIPSEKVYVAALERETGQPIWSTEMNDVPAQGYMLASRTRLYVMTGRDKPVVFDAQTGKRLHKVGGGTGGTYALLTGDTLYYGPSKTGQVDMIGPNKQDVLATFAGSHMIVARPYTFLHSGKELSSLNRERYVELYAQRNKLTKQRKQVGEKYKKAKGDEADQLKAQVKQLDADIKQTVADLKACVAWKAPCDCPYALILAKQTLIAGGIGQVRGYDSASGKLRWQLQVPGKVYGLAVSDGKLYVSTDTGAIYCYGEKQPSADGQDDQPAPKPVPIASPLAAKARPKQAYIGPFAAKRPAPGQIHGPFAEFIADGKVNVTWHTTEPMTTELKLAEDLDAAEPHVDKELKTDHQVEVTGLQRDIVHRLQVAGETADGTRIETEAYLFDTHFDYMPVGVKAADPFEADSLSKTYQSFAAQCLETLGGRRGYALVLDSVDGRLAFELARQSEMQVVIVVNDAQKAATLRSKLVPTGLYGTRISVHQSNQDEVLYGPYLANLLVSAASVHGGANSLDNAERYYRTVRPSGGVIVRKSANAESNGDAQESQTLDELTWTPIAESNLAFHRRGQLENSGEWTHQYGSGDNTSCSKDDRIGGEMVVQWWGRPGARPMPDRGNRNPAPVSANGRLYVQGNRTLFGLDAYNGTILWSKQIPSMRRANVPRDGSNMVVMGDVLWVAMGSYAVGFDGQTGQRILNHSVPETEKELDWGFLSHLTATADQTQKLVLGSGVRKGSQYHGDLGEWYEKFDAKHTARVNSDMLFAVDWYTGQAKWKYDQGVVMNSTITVADEVVYFIESRNGDAKGAESGRLLDEVLQDQYLVALRAGSGEVLWEQPFDFSQCEAVTYMTTGSGVLLVSGTDRKAKFHTYAFDASSGELMWQHHVDDQKKHHTGHLAHPTIVGDRVYFNKHTYELKTGKIVSVHKFNWHGCGVMSASSKVIFSRYEYHGMLELETNKRTEFLGIRSGCWLSLIPSGGLLLAPETSAGCSCGHSLQTSIAYVPKRDLELEAAGADEAE